MRKGITVLLAVLLLFSQAFAETAQKAPDYTMEGYDGELSGRNWETNLFFSRMQEITGISFQFSQFTDAERWTERKREILQGENLPDVLFKAELTSSEVRDLYEAGRIIDLAPYGRSRSQTAPSQRSRPSTACRTMTLCGSIPTG